MKFALIIVSAFFLVVFSFSDFSALSSSLQNPAVADAYDPPPSPPGNPDPPPPLPPDPFRQA
jgi:hypothetical protein